MKKSLGSMPNFLMREIRVVRFITICVVDDELPFLLLEVLDQRRSQPNRPSKFVVTVDVSTASSILYAQSDMESMREAQGKFLEQLVSRWILSPIILNNLVAFG